MPNKITLVEVIPALWDGLRVTEDDIVRPVKRSTFEFILTTSGTVVSAPVVKRMWNTFRNSDITTNYRPKPEMVDLVVEKAYTFMSSHGRALEFYSSDIGLNSRDVHTHSHIHTAKEGAQ